MSKKRILIFASGRGSNAEAIHEATVNGTANGTVVGVICDHADAQVLKRAERWGVPTTVLELKSFENKEAFNEARDFFRETMPGCEPLTHKPHNLRAGVVAAVIAAALARQAGANDITRHYLVSPPASKAASHNS